MFKSGSFSPRVRLPQASLPRTLCKIICVHLPSPMSVLHSSVSVPSCREDSARSEGGSRQSVSTCDVTQVQGSARQLKAWQRPPPSSTHRRIYVTVTPARSKAWGPPQPPRDPRPEQQQLWQLREAGASSFRGALHRIED